MPLSCKTIMTRKGLFRSFILVVCSHSWTVENGLTACSGIAVLQEYCNNINNRTKLE